ncbi:MAG: DUF3052 domain-containing protein [Myxococcota bacterium]
MKKSAKRVTAKNAAAKPTASAGYSSASLPQKLGIHASDRVGLVNAPKDFAALLVPLPEGVRLLPSPRGETELSLWFPRNLAELSRDIGRRAERIGVRGIWVCWPKKASGVPTDLDENRIRDAALAVGLVDIKVCAIDATYSGLKLTRRKA